MNATLGPFSDLCKAMLQQFITGGKDSVREEPVVVDFM
jgi:hypothetical protein